MTSRAQRQRWSGPVAKCPVRPGDACTLCQPGAHGPEDCGLVYLVMNDPDLRDQLAALRAGAKAPSGR